MSAVARTQILDYETYEDQRDDIRAAAMQAKELRRVVVAGHLTFLFENEETVRYQILEMVRVERLVRESDIQREIDTYNELLGGPGELGCSLLIGIADPEERGRKLHEWMGLLEGLYVELEDGARIRPTHDPGQVDDGKLSAVQFLKFDTGGRVPVAVGSDFVALEGRSELASAQREALASDLNRR